MTNDMLIVSFRVASGALSARIAPGGQGMVSLQVDGAATGDGVGRSIFLHMSDDALNELALLVASFIVDHTPAATEAYLLATRQEQ